MEVKYISTFQLAMVTLMILSTTGPQHLTVSIKFILSSAFPTTTCSANQSIGTDENMGPFVLISSAFAS